MKPVRFPVGQEGFQLDTGLDPKPYRDYEIVKHDRANGLVDLGQVRCQLVGYSGKPSSVSGTSLQGQARERGIPMNAVFLECLLQNPRLFPPSWAKYCVFFTGTVYRCVRGWLFERSCPDAVERDGSVLVVRYATPGEVSRSRRHGVAVLLGDHLNFPRPNVAACLVG